MSLAPVRLTRLTSRLSIVDDQGRPSPAFQRYINDLLGTVETALNGVIDAQNAAAAAQSSADTASSAAATAQSTADTKVTQAQTDALYVHQDTTATWGAATGTLDRSAYAAYTAPTISASPTQAEVQAVANGLQASSRHIAALIADLIANSTVTG